MVVNKTEVEISVVGLSFLNSETESRVWYIKDRIMRMCKLKQNES